MARLNASAAEAMLRYEVHSATDITGFGLVGHALKMAEGSGVALRFEASLLPLLPGARRWSRKGMIPGGGRRNHEFFGPRVQVSERIPLELAELAYDPQTSGGLLIALPDREADALLADLRVEGNLDAAIVGCVGERGPVAIELF
jgi:selenide,water dikinase